MNINTLFYIHLFKHFWDFSGILIDTNKWIVNQLYMCAIPKPKPSVVFLYIDPWPLGAANQEVDSVKGIDWFVVNRWLFISFHIGGLTLDDPSMDQSAQSHDLHPFATVLISFDGPWVCIVVVKWSPAVPWLKKDPVRLLDFMPTISSCRMSNTLNLMYQQILLNYLYAVEVCVCVCLCACLVVLNGVHMSVYVQLSENTQACWCLHVRGGETETESLPFGMGLHILQHIAVGWGNLLLSKIIELLHPVISLIIMKASLQFSNYYSMPIMFLSNKEEHWSKTKCQDPISCLCLRAIQRWGTYTPTKYNPQYPT